MAAGYPVVSAGPIHSNAFDLDQDVSAYQFCRQHLRQTPLSGLFDPITDVQALVSGFEVHQHPDPHTLCMTLADRFRGASLQVTRRR